jgi:aarF domain-containing kinase
MHSKGDIVLAKLGTEIAEIIFPDFKYKWLGKEFEINLPKELDFRNEGKNADKIRELSKNDNRVVVIFIFI